MSDKLNVLEVSDLSDATIDKVIEQLDDRDVDSAMIMGFGSGQDKDDVMKNFSEKLAERIKQRQVDRERAQKSNAETAGSKNNGIEDYTSLADVSEEMRKRVMTAVVVQAVIGKSSCWNDLLVSNELLRSMKD